MYPIGRETSPLAGKRGQWPGNDAPVRNTPQLGGKRFDWAVNVFTISENAGDFDTQLVVYFATSQALSLYGIIPKYGRVDQHGRGAFRLAGYRLPYFGKCMGRGYPRGCISRNFPKSKLMVPYPEIWAHWPTWTGNFPLGRGGVFPSLENAGGLSPNVVYCAISPNLSLQGIIPIYGRIGQHGRETFRLYGKRFPYFRKRGRILAQRLLIAQFHQV